MEAVPERDGQKPFRGNRTIVKRTIGKRCPKMKKAAAVRPSPEVPKAAWELRIYVAGQSRRSLLALANLKRICDEQLAGKYRIEVVDLVKHPQLAIEDQILAVPTIIRRLPSPIRKIIGDLSSNERALIGLDLLPAPAAIR
jgi:circadian clock protein KaiB